MAKFNTRLLQKRASTYDSVSKQEFWKLKRAPYAVPDKCGNEVNDICNIQNAYLDEFRYRPRQQEIPQNLKDYENIQNSLCHLRLEICQGNVSPDFTMQELSKAISESKKAHMVLPGKVLKEMGMISHCPSSKWSTQS